MHTPFLRLMVCWFLTLAAIHAAPVEATFGSPTSVPVTAAGYVATGNTVNLSLGFVPPTGTTLTVVKNTGTSFISGVFDNLPNGATVNLSHGGQTYPFVAWYYGNDGNDLVLLWPITGIAAWGSGLLGDGTTRSSSLPRRVIQSGVLASKTIVQVAVGSDHTLALASDGQVYAWGRNPEGEAGDGSTAWRNVPIAVSTVAGSSALSGKFVVAISAGENHSLALCSDGTLVAWGSSDASISGDGSYSGGASRHLIPAAVNFGPTSAFFGKTVVAISSGAEHWLALCSDGSLVAWGENNYGQLGDGSSSPRTVPVAVNTTQGGSALFGKTVVAISCGDSHSLALCSDGSAVAWGLNNLGQLGYGSDPIRTAPVLVDRGDSSALSGRTIVTLSAGAHHSLALCSDGSLVAWGLNSYGQLGNGSTVTSNLPVAVDMGGASGALSGKTVVKLVSGRGHSIVLCSDGSLAAWGTNYYGELGDGTDTQRSTPVAVNTGDPSSALFGRAATSLASGSVTQHSVALYSAASPPEIKLEALEPTPAVLASGVDTIDFGATISGGVRTFRVTNIAADSLPLPGLAVHLEGPDAAAFTLLEPVPIGLFEGQPVTFRVSLTGPAAGVKNARLHLTCPGAVNASIVVALTGEIQTTAAASFTSPTSGTLTLANPNLTGTTLDLSLAFAPPLGTELLLIRNTGIPFIVGSPSGLPNGSIVNLTHDGTTYPFVVWYYGGDGNDLVLRWPTTGLAAWGDNSSGQLGNASTKKRNIPTPVDQSGALAGKTIISIAHGQAHSLALTSEGLVYAWGANSFGQLGNASTKKRNIPTPVDQSGALAGKTIISVAHGQAHSLALTSEGLVYAWGANSFGQLGDGSTTSRTVPVPVNTANGTSALAGKFVVAVSAGEKHSLALCSDGTLTAWGDGSSDKLAGAWNSSGPATNPVAFSTTDEASALFGKFLTAVSTGDNHSIALCSDGTLVAWGANHSSQLGNDVFGTPLRPVQVKTTAGSALFGKTVLRLAAGSDHSLALCADGTVASWGNNAQGQLGNGTTVSSATPVFVDAGSGSSALAGKTVVAVAAGNSHTLALCSDGTIASWGHNGGGQLGDGSTITRSSPVAVNTSAGSSALAGKFVVSTSVASATSLAVCSDGSLVAWGSNFYGQLGDGAALSWTIPGFVDTSAASALRGKPVAALPSGSSSSRHSLAIYGASGSAALQVEFLSPVATTLANGDTVDFGETVSGGAVRTLRISNPSASSLPLQALSLSLNGPDGSAFTVLDSAPPFLLGGESATFRVNLIGPAAGWKTAELRISSNAGGIPSTFVVVLTGSIETTIPLSLTSPSDASLPLTSPDFSASSLDLSLGFAPEFGSELLVVRNIGQGLITGYFANLPNGAPITLTYNGTSYPFVAWYYGGDGNDLVLRWPVNGLAAWGANASGQLGDNTTISKTHPSSIDPAGILAGKTVVQIARGASHTLVLTSEGRVYAWGSNAYGQLGIGSTTNSRTPVAVNQADGSHFLFGKVVVAVAAGESHSLALCSDGSIAAWGSNLYGQLGDGSNTQRTSPVPVSTGGISALSGKSVVGLAAGTGHSLALCADGSIAAWGRNHSGELGNGTSDPSFLPTAVVSPGEPITMIAAGAHHSLALTSGGTVVSWGENFYGQLGDGTTLGHSLPAPVNASDGSSALFGKTVVRLSAGLSHSLALCSDGTLASWGANEQGQLGDGTTIRRTSPVAVDVAAGTSALAGKSVVSIYGGASHSLALCFDGTVASWGINYSGQLGDGSATSRPIPIAVDAADGSSALHGRTVTTLAHGSNGSHSVALYAANPPILRVEVLEPFPTTLVNGPDAVDFGSTFSGAAVRTFRVSNLASNSVPPHGYSVNLTGTGAAAFQLSGPSPLPPGGDSTTFRITMASTSPGSKTALVQLVRPDATNSPFSFALSGTVANTASLSFSTPSDGAMALPDPELLGYTLNLTLNFSPPIGTDLKVIDNTGSRLIAGTFTNLPNGATVHLPYGGQTYPFIVWYYGGDGNDLVLLWPVTGLAAWGVNIAGQLGDGSTFQRSIPTAADQTGVLSGKRIVQVAAGLGHTLALTTEGRVYAWGANTYGQLGDGSTSGQTSPVAVLATDSALSGKFVIAISAGSHHSLALCSDGTVVAWGRNHYGQIGTGPGTTRPTPTAVYASGSSALSGKSVVAISAGGMHSLALCSDGTIATWGANPEPRYTPIPVRTDSSSALFGKSVVAISAGSTHSLALCADGALVGWGSNSSGELGTGFTSSLSLPVFVRTLDASSALFGKTVTAISARHSHSLALCSDGSVAAWGLNAEGQLGDGSTINRSTPVPVDTGSATSALFNKSVAAISTGAAHSLALCSDGTLVAWGRNTFNQLGDGTTASRLSPALVDTDNADSALLGRRPTSLASGPGAHHSLALCSLAAPVIGQRTATGIRGTRATLSVTINPNNAATTAWLEYGLTRAYGSSVNVALSPANGDLPQTLSTELTGLVPQTTYHFRFVAKVSGGTVYGQSQTFQTTALSSLENWKQTEFGADAGNSVIAGDLADPDSDGIPNLLEYALLRSALQPDPLPFGAPQLTLTQPGNVPAHRFVFDYRPDADEIRYIVQRSSDLTGWSDIFRHDPATASSIQAGNVVGDPNPELGTLTITDQTAGQKLFWRLVVEPVP